MYQNKKTRSAGFLQLPFQIWESSQNIVSSVFSNDFIGFLDDHSSVANEDRYWEGAYVWSVFYLFDAMLLLD